ncbi:MAG: phenylacetate--CoA ligase family protein [Methanomassiliicoccales archaeon]|nr:phenylacetate--CoA ligase family protein [Methanomassiliicoccales archaeon]
MSIKTRIAIAYARTKLSSRKVSEDVENPLHEWVQLKVRNTFKQDEDFRKALGRSKLGEIDRAVFEEYQLHRFRKQVAYVMENSYYYQRKYAEAGVVPERIRTMEDLDQVPLTEPADLAEEPFLFLCVSQSRIARTFSTSGTSGKNKRLFYTREDLLNIIDSIAAALRSAGLKSNETLHIMFPAVVAWDPSLMLESACKVAGLKSVVCSEVDVDEQVRVMRERGTRVIIGLTSFIYRVTVLARERYDLRSLGLKAIICSSEPLSEAVRREMEEAWGCKCLSQYGMTEMGLATAIECHEQTGLHINEADFLVEVIDPDSGKRLPPGEEGELVWTSLSFQGSPLLRYRSYDISHYIPPPCPCGHLTVGKIGKPKGRRDAATKIGLGERIFPVLFDEAIMQVKGALNYQLVIDKPSFRDRLHFTVEYSGDMERGRREVMEALTSLDEIKNGLDNDLLEPIEVEMREVSKDFTPKMKPIIDRRQSYDN